MLPLAIDEPTLAMTFMPNTSPFAGKEGRFVTSRQIKDRLDRELLSNVGLKVEPGPSAERFIVSGRGTLHLSVLIETMRREGFELAVSQPQVILREVDGAVHEPFEHLQLDCGEAFSGSVIEKLNKRGGNLEDLMVDSGGQSRMQWSIPSRGLIGYRSEFMTDTRGTGNLYHNFSHYGPSSSAAARVQTAS